MAANLFSRLESFREENQVMAAHWFSGRLLKLIIMSDSLTHSVSYLRRYRAARAAKYEKNDVRAYCTKLPIGLNRLPLKIKHIGPTVNLEVLRAQLSSEERTN